MKGTLQLKDDSVDFMLFTGNLINLSEKLNKLLLKKIAIIIKEENDIIFSEVGKLARLRNIEDNLNDKSHIYNYHLNNKNLEQLLWNLVGKKIEIKIKCLGDIYDIG